MVEAREAEVLVWYKSKRDVLGESVNNFPVLMTLAQSDNRLDIVAYLVSQRGGPRAKVSDIGETFLHMFALDGYVAGIEWLIKEH
jgi:hypothetical protein